MNQSYGAKDNASFPVWTNPKPGILEALRLPEHPGSPTPTLEVTVVCVFCDLTFSHPDQHQELLRHLLSEHKFVIADVHLIGDFPAYLSYWRTKFRTCLVSAYCTTMKAEVTEPGMEGQLQEFNFLSDIVPEDKELRRKLQMDKLEHVLAVQETERNDLSFSRGCLFCRQVFIKHKLLFDHMAFDHNFSVGQPDNLVYVRKFLDMIEEKLEALVCLHCEKIFKSREVLKEHMRKKQHKQLNPKNKIWDQFYLANYLEFGRNWEEQAREPEEVVDYWDLEENKAGDDREWSDWQDDHGGMVCLFCPATYQDTADLTNHMVVVHGFDFLELRGRLELNFYQQVKLINYIRRSVHLNTCIGCGELFPSKELLLEHMTWSSHHSPSLQSDWDQPQYYFPTYENDNLLFGLEDPDTEGNTDKVPTVLAEDISVEDSILAKEEVRRELVPQRVRNKGPKSRGNNNS